MDVNHTWYRWRGATLLLHLRVHPGARAEQAEAIHDGRIKVKTTAPPVDGRANRALARWLAGEFGVARHKVELVRGARQGRRDYRPRRAASVVYRFRRRAAKLRILGSVFRLRFR
ncbi:MAG: DUF167 domain-containing protein [Gammaproteobacteria bacterium]